MAANSLTRPRTGSFLLELLYYAGWRLEVSDAEGVRIHAVRDDVKIDVAGSTLSEAAGTAFARAMRWRRNGRPAGS